MSTADRERQQVTMRSMKRLSTKQREAGETHVAEIAEENQKRQPGLPDVGAPPAAPDAWPLGSG
jgi:hypothetical protein